MEQLQSGHGQFPRPSFDDPDGLTPQQQQRQAQLLASSQQLYSTLSLRRQQQLAETLLMQSPGLFPEPMGRPSSVHLRRSTTPDGMLAPLPTTPSLLMTPGGAATTPSPAFVSFRSDAEIASVQTDDIVDDARLNTARVRELGAELRISREETQRALSNGAEVALRTNQMAEAYRYERATHAAERIADAMYDAQQDCVDAFRKASAAQEKRCAALQKNAGLRQRIGDVIGVSSEALEAELRRYHGADEWMEDDLKDESQGGWAPLGEEGAGVFDWTPVGWQLHYPIPEPEKQGERLVETRQHAEDLLKALPARYRKVGAVGSGPAGDLSVADLMAARVYTMETEGYREKLALACRQMADWRFIDTDVDNPPPQFGRMFFHLKRAAMALKGAKDEARFYRREPGGFEDLLQDATCEVGRLVTWHEFKIVTNAGSPPGEVALLNGSKQGGGDGDGGVLYKIVPRGGHHFGNLGAYLCTADPLSISARTDHEALGELLLPPGVCFRVKSRVREFGCEVVTMEFMGLWVDAFPAAEGEESYATMEQVEEDEAEARQEYTAAQEKCEQLKQQWKESFEAWQDALAALAALGGQRPDDDETESSVALAAAREILRQKYHPVPEPEPESCPMGEPSEEQLGAVFGEADWQVVASIQARQRGNLARQSLLQEKQAATKIQSVQRGKLTRRGSSSPSKSNLVGKPESAAPPSSSCKSPSKKLNATSTFEPDGTGRVWASTHEERMILHLTHK